MPIELISNPIQKNRSANVSSTAFFYLMDTSNIDYRVKNIQQNSSLNPLPAQIGDKYIIRNVNSLNAGFTGIGGPIQGLQNNDIVIFQSGGFALYVDVSNTKTNQGGIVYNDADDKLYYYNGSIWRGLGIGSLIGTTNQIQITGSTGDLQVGLTPIVVIENTLIVPVIDFNGITMGLGQNKSSIQVTGNLNITGDLLVNGEIVTKSGFKGYTLDAEIEELTDVSVDAGVY
jgi:hypothetical protein